MSYKYVKKINNEYDNDLLEHALKFIDESCSELRFDQEISEREKTEGFKGTSGSRACFRYKRNFRGLDN